MIYKLNKKYLKHVCSEQKASMLNTFTGCKQDRDFIYIDYVDKNYLCMPMLEKIRDSKTCALSLFFWMRWTRHRYTDGRCKNHLNSRF